MLYYLACGYDDHFSLKTCVKLGTAFSIGLLSYYSVYGWILMGSIFCVFAVLPHATRMRSAISVPTIKKRRFIFLFLVFKQFKD